MSVAKALKFASPSNVDEHVLLGLAAVGVKPCCDEGSGKGDARVGVLPKSDSYSRCGAPSFAKVLCVNGHMCADAADSSGSKAAGLMTPKFW